MYTILYNEENKSNVLSSLIECLMELKFYQTVFNPEEVWLEFYFTLSVTFAQVLETFSPSEFNSKSWVRIYWVLNNRTKFKVADCDETSVYYLTTPTVFVITGLVRNDSLKLIFFNGL